MGIRSNVGNIMTNAVQTMSIAGTTASRVFGKNKGKKPSIGSADTTLNNPSIDDILKPDSQVDMQNELISEKKDKDTINIAPQTIEGQAVNTYSNRSVFYLEDYLAPEEKRQEFIDEGAI